MKVEPGNMFWYLHHTHKRKGDNVPKYGTIVGNDGPYVQIQWLPSPNPDSGQFSQKPYWIERTDFLGMLGGGNGGLLK